MCTTNVYSYVYADGRQESVHQPTLCTASKHGKVCPKNVTFQHPAQYVGFSGTQNAGAASPYLTQMPPTPTYTPRSSTPNYRSGDESDRSHRSGSSSSRNHRSSGVYINGQKVMNLERNRRSSSSASRRERIVLVENPPTPRTPPQLFTAPHTAPSSPSMPYFLDAAQREREAHLRRPVIVDERNSRGRVQIEVVDAPYRTEHRSHSRHPSTSSRNSASDEEKVRRRRAREEQRLQVEAEARELRKLERIAKANRDILKRPAVPMPPPPPRRSATTANFSTSPKPASGFTRPHVEVVSDRDAELAEALRRLNFEEQRREEKARSLEAKQAREEEAAQRQRLKERMMPKRRATVGPGSRRQRVLYDDGVYRWE